MNRTVLTRPAKVKTLAQQNTDFTAEGAPPPGIVAMSIPDKAHERKEAASRSASDVHGAHKRPPASKNG